MEPKEDWSVVAPGLGGTVPITLTHLKFKEGLKERGGWRKRQSYVENLSGGA